MLFRNPDITYLAICHLSILIPQRKRKFEFAIPGRIDPTLEFLGWKLVIAAAQVDDDHLERRESPLGEKLTHTHLVEDIEDRRLLPLATLEW